MSVDYGTIAGMEPLLKWAGGKRHIAKVVRSHFPESWNEGSYIEPFAGGAAMFFDLSPQRAVLSDINHQLIGFYRVLKNSPQDLFDAISIYAADFECLETAEEKKAVYLGLRSRFNQHVTGIEGAALFYALNKLSFNGLYRENSKGLFNVPFGQKTAMQVYSFNTFQEASDILQSAELHTEDFEQAIMSAQDGDFVYFDPPYVPMTPTASFTAYTSQGFGKIAQERLAKSMRELAKRGVRALLSNSNTQATREIYKGLRFETILAPRRVSAKTSGRGTVEELLIANY